MTTVERKDTWASYQPYIDYVCPDCDRGTDLPHPKRLCLRCWKEKYVYRMWTDE